MKKSQKLRDERMRLELTRPTLIDLHCLCTPRRQILQLWTLACKRPADGDVRTLTDRRISSISTNTCKEAKPYYALTYRSVYSCNHATERLGSLASRTT